MVKDTAGTAQESRGPGPPCEERGREGVVDGLVRRYTIALVVLAALATVKFACFEVIDARSHRVEAQINLAGRQRMYSQRIALMSLRLRLAQPSAAVAVRREFGDALESMEAEQAALLNGSTVLGVPPPSGDLARLYFDEGLAAEVARYLALAHEVWELPPDRLTADAPAEQALQAAASPELLARLERAVWLAEEDARSTRAVASVLNTASYVGVIGILAYLAVGVFGPMMRTLRDEMRRVADAERDQARASRRNAFVARLHDAMDMAVTEADLLVLFQQALDRERSLLPAAVLLSDGSHAHLRTVAGASGVVTCDVDAPARCVAVRRGHLMRFSSSADIEACPRLRVEGRGACSALCVPLAFKGESLGVLHVPGPEGAPPEGEPRELLEAFAAQAANRLGSLRSLDLAQEQAATDPLTGLMNRRALDAAVRRLEATSTRYAVVMADLDHFKHLNDTYGHEAGDHALRAFARLFREAMRAEDTAVRHGGEEFVALLPGATAEVGAKTAARVRLCMAEHLPTTGGPVFTASFGVADSFGATCFAEVLHLADVALLRAKGEGRDRVVVADGTPGAPADVPRAAAGPGERRDRLVVLP